MDLRILALLIGLCLGVASCEAPSFPKLFSRPVTADPIVRALTDSARFERDSTRDELRKPAAVLAFFGVEPGMTVLDFFSGGGYYAEILARAVGPDGKVIAYNNQAYLNFVVEEYQKRYSENRLPNVVHLHAETSEFAVAPESLDLALLTISYHDFYYVNEEHDWHKIDRARVLEAIYQGLKPGAVFGIVDHVAPPGSDPYVTGGYTHRIDPAVIVADLEAAGFTLDGSLDVLRNPDDDYSKSVFAEGIRGHTDRVVLRFRKTQKTSEASE